MLQRSEMVFKALLSRCSAEERLSLERFLPEKERLRLSTLPSFNEEREEKYSRDDAIERIHWSWFLPTLKTYAPRDQRLFLSALSPHAREQLAHCLGQPGSMEEITETARLYLRQQLLSNLLEPQQWILPAEFLPLSPLNKLLDLNKKELVRLIDILSLYDLHAEFRHIVETKTLKKIYSLLSEEQRSALKHIQKETYVFPKFGTKLGLERWDGTEQSLRMLLHKRGLAKLGVALSGQDSDLIWAICHHLDIGRGGALLKSCTKEAIPDATPATMQQIEKILSLL